MSNASAATIEKTTRITLMRLLLRILLHPSAVLLFVQLAGLLLYPFIEQTRPARAALGAFGVLVLGLAILMVRHTPGRAWISFGIAVPAVAFNVMDLDRAGLAAVVGGTGSSVLLLCRWLPDQLHAG